MVKYSQPWNPWLSDSGLQITQDDLHMWVSFCGVNREKAGAASGMLQKTDLPLCRRSPRQLPCQLQIAMFIFNLLSTVWYQQFPVCRIMISRLIDTIDAERDSPE